MSDDKPTPQAVLEARRVSKTYVEGASETQVLDGLSLSIPEGSFAAITGQSGVGKSTLLHLLGFIDRPTVGEIIYRGRDAAGFQRRQRAAVRNRDFGFVFQAYHLVNELDAAENVMLPAMITSVGGWLGRRREVRERAETLLERVGLKERMQHRPLQLSGGERQRVAIARALINRPAVLFCDEPTGNLDEKTSRDVFDLICSLHEQEGMTLVVVTHEPQYAGKAGLLYQIHAGRAEKLR